MSRAIAQLESSMNSPFAEKQPDQDLVPVGIYLWNEGESPANNIGIFLRFPEECKLVEKRDAIGRISISTTPRTYGELYTDKDDETTATAQMDRLGNDRAMKNFDKIYDKIYIRFPPEEKEYTIKTNILQDNFSPIDLEFKILVRPQIKEVTRYKSENIQLPVEIVILSIMKNGII